MIRRSLFKGLVLMAGGIMRPRPDQLPRPGTPGLPPAAVPGNVFAYLYVVGPKGGLFFYSPAAATGELDASIAAAGSTDKFGNTVEGGIVSYAPGDNANYVKMFTAEIAWGTLNASSIQTVAALLEMTATTAPAGQPSLIIQSPSNNSSQNRVVVRLFGESQNGAEPAQAIVTTNPGFTADTSSLLEVQGQEAVNGPFLLAEQSAAPSATAGYGTLYTDTSGNLWYLAPGGTSTKLAPGP